MRRGLRGRAVPGARGGFAPERIYLHGNNKTDAELDYALEQGVGHIVVDSFDEIDRLERIAPGQKVLLRVTPGIKPDTHAYIPTGQEDSKFGFGLDEVPRAIERSEAARAVRPARAHRLAGVRPRRRTRSSPRCSAGMGDYPLLNLGGGLGIAYTAEDQEPPSVEDYVDALLRAPGGRDRAVRAGPLARGNAGVTIYTVGTVKRIPGVRTYVAVDGGMSDNLRPMLYGARYEAEIADRFGGDTLCTVAGKHCESGDILVRDVLLDDPRPGDVLVTPATGAYGHAMANNYNAIPRPPVVFCKDGDARVVVRRETYDDLTLRDV